MEAKLENAGVGSGRVESGRGLGSERWGSPREPGSREEVRPRGRGAVEVDRGSGCHGGVSGRAPCPSPFLEEVPFAK